MCVRLYAYKYIYKASGREWISNFCGLKTRQSVKKTFDDPDKKNERNFRSPSQLKSEKEHCSAHKRKKKEAC